MRNSAKKRIAAIGFAALSIALAPATRAQYTGNNQTNIISGVTSNWTGNGTYVVGSNTFLDALQVYSGGVLSNGFGYIGYQTGGSNNLAAVTSTGSVWNNCCGLYVGYSGAGNRLVVSNGGAVFIKLNGTSFLGYNGTSSNNVVVVTGTGSVWTMGADLVIGNSGAGNQLVVNDGGAVSSGFQGWLGATSSSSSNAVLVTGTGSVWSNHNDIYVGYSGSFTSLVISNGGKVFNAPGFLGYNGGSISNMATVTGSGSTWSSSSDLYVGYSGTANQLIVTNGGAVFNAYGILGYHGSSGNNMAEVTGSGSTWSSGNDLYVGDSGAGCRLAVSDGGAVFDSSGFVGFGSASSNSVAIANGNGSIWSNLFDVCVGVNGSSNQLVITNSGVVFNNSGYIGGYGGGYGVGSSNNVVTVIGNGARWENRAELYVGDYGDTNTLNIGTGGSVIASNAYVGFNNGADGNRINVTGGLLYITNAPGTGKLDIRRGTLTCNAGAITVDNLLLTNGAFAALAFNSGSLNSKGTAVTNTHQFTVGDSVSAANLHLLGGVHSFSNGLRIRNSATLSGCGTINGVVVLDAGSTVLADCSSLVFGQSITNNGTMVAVSNSFLTFFGPVVNNSTIVTTNGSVRFYASIVNNGTVVLDSHGDADGDGIPNGWEQAHGYDPLNAADGMVDTDGDGQGDEAEMMAGTDPTNGASAFRILGVVPTNNDMLVSWSAGGGRTNIVQVATDLTVSYTNVSPNIILIGSGDVTTNYLDAGAATNSASRFYRVLLVP